MFVPRTPNTPNIDCETWLQTTPAVSGHTQPLPVLTAMRMNELFPFLLY